MIRREVDGGWLMISQPAHAWGTGEMARAWGSAACIAPSPRAETILATTLHDIGWQQWDSAPPLKDDGTPAHFYDTDLATTEAIWHNAQTVLRLYHPYAALLVSHHASTVFRARLARTENPTDRDVLEERVREQVQIQVDLTGEMAHMGLYAGTDALEPARILANYRVLRTCDLLSLAVCVQAPQRGEIPDVPGQTPDERVTISIEPEGDSTLVLTPYPFAVPEVSVVVQGRLLPRHTYPDAERYHDALRRAPWHELTFTFVPGD